MLTIKTTPSLYGISLMGDYQDLNSLYDSLNRYLSFYTCRVFKEFPYHEYEYLLSLNYDIRHAYMGTREVEIMENNAEDVGVQAEAIYQIPDSMKKEFQKTRLNHKNGNLYFSVNILYPLIFHYLIAFEFILEDEPEECCFGEREDASIEGYWINDYTYLDAEADRAQMGLLTSLLWKNVQELLGKEKTSLAFFNSRVHSSSILQYFWIMEVVIWALHEIPLSFRNLSVCMILAFSTMLLSSADVFPFFLLLRSK